VVGIDSANRDGGRFLTNVNLSGADHSLDYNSLTYRDPTGDEAVRNLSPGDVSITWPDGFTIWVPASQARLLSRFLSVAYSFRMSRKAHIWATPKKNDPAALAGADGARSTTQPSRSRRTNV
jgi:hypothetical protein